MSQPFHDPEIERRSRVADSLNTQHKRGAPPTDMASPITTGFGPLDDGVLDDVVGIGDPTDTIGILPGGKGRRKR